MKYKIVGKDGEHEFKLTLDGDILRLDDYPEMEADHMIGVINTGRNVISFLENCHLKEFSVKAID